MATIVNAKFKQKRGTEESMPTLLEGELYVCTDSKKLYVGTASGNQLICDISKLNEKVDKSQIVNNCLTTEEGYIADARTLKTLYDMCKMQECSITWASGIEGFIDIVASNASIKCYKVGKIVILNVALKLTAAIPSRQTLFTINNFSSPIAICAAPAHFDSGESGYISIDGNGNVILDGTNMANGYIRSFIVTVTN